MQNELTTMRNRNTLLRAEQSRLNADFLQLRKKITVMDDRRNEQG